MQRLFADPTPWATPWMGACPAWCASSSRGGETEVCVLATVLGAIDIGYRVVIATDALCSSADATHNAMLEIYHGRFGMQVETAETARSTRRGGRKGGGFQGPFTSANQVTNDPYFPRAAKIAWAMSAKPWPAGRLAIHRGGRGNSSR
jgi:hypothetical protein